jgi:hypothetical protein
MKALTTIPATRVGVQRVNGPGKHPRVECIRCGRRRQARNDSKPIPPLCRDCKSVDPTFGQEVAC